MSRRSGSPTSSPSGLPATCTASSAPSTGCSAPSWPCRSLAAQTVNSSGIRIGGTSTAAMGGRGYHRSVRSAVVATPERGLHLVHVCSGSPNLAADPAAAEGIVIAMVLVAEDVASAPKERADTRRGSLGSCSRSKYAGAAAERGDALDAVADTARHALENTRSMEPFGPRALPAQQN